MGLLEALKLKAAPSDPDSASPPMIKVEEGKDSVTFRQKPDGASLTIKRDLVKKPIFKKTFMVGPVPCFTKGDVALAVQGEISRKADASGLKVEVTVSGSFGIGPGVAEGPFTVGMSGTATLSSAQGVAVSYSEAKGVVAEAFVCHVKASGKVGIEATIDNGPSVKAEVPLVEWELVIVHVAGYANGKLQGVRVEQGRDLQRLIAMLESAGKKISQAIDDAGDGLERGARAVLDPGGETGRETTERNKRIGADRQTSSDEFVPAMIRLDTDLKSFCTAAERQVVHDAYQQDNGRALQGEARTDTWKTEYALLLDAALRRKAQAAVDKVRREARAKADAAEDLARRVKDSERRLATTLQEVNQLGNPLKNGLSPLPADQALKKWREGMVFRDRAVPLLKQIPATQGEARIVKADEATGLLMKACAEFR